MACRCVLWRDGRSPAFIVGPDDLRSISVRSGCERRCISGLERGHDLRCGNAVGGYRVYSCRQTRGLPIPPHLLRTAARHHGVLGGEWPRRTRPRLLREVLRRRSPVRRSRLAVGRRRAVTRPRLLREVLRRRSPVRRSRLAVGRRRAVTRPRLLREVLRRRSPVRRSRLAVGRRRVVIRLRLLVRRSQQQRKRCCLATCPTRSTVSPPRRCLALQPLR